MPGVVLSDRMGAQLTDLTLSTSPVEEDVDVPDVGVDRVAREGAAAAAALEQVGGEAVQRPGIQVAGLGQAMLGAPGQEHLLERVAVGVSEGLRGEAPGPVQSAR